MITIEVRYPDDSIFSKRVDEDESMVMLSQILYLADLQDASIKVRVTGAPTAASCRHHPLSPGLIGDPRR